MLNTVHVFLNISNNPSHLEVTIWSIQIVVILCCVVMSYVGTVPNIFLYLSDAVGPNDLCNQWGICGQDCELDQSEPRGYRCTCFEGYFLEPDKFTCKPLGQFTQYLQKS